MRRLARILAGVLLLACSKESGSTAGDTGSADIASVADSLALSMNDGAEVWLTDAMLDSASTGESCRLRSIEIRRQGQATPVPLLYTASGLVMEDDTTFRAQLFRQCAVSGTYLVNTRNGQPRRID
jgi:hypothetical protein